jgi:hypothetical protein
MQAKSVSPVLRRQRRKIIPHLLVQIGPLEISSGHTGSSEVDLSLRRVVGRQVARFLGIDELRAQVELERHPSAEFHISVEYR